MHWLGWLAAGTAWIVVVLAALLFSLHQADSAAAQDLIGEPNSAQVFVAWVSSGIFSVPGIAFIIVGFRKRRSTGRQPKPAGTPQDHDAGSRR